MGEVMVVMYDLIKTRPSDQHGDIVSGTHMALFLLSGIGIYESIADQILGKDEKICYIDQEMEMTTLDEHKDRDDRS